MIYGSPVENATKTGDFFREGFRELVNMHEWIGDVRGLGLHIGVELVRDRATGEHHGAFIS